MNFEQPDVLVADGKALIIATSAGETHVSDVDAVVLARDLLVSAMLLHAKHPPQAGVQVSCAPIHVLRWQVGVSKHDVNPIVRLTVVPDVTLEFRLSPEVARDLGQLSFR